MDSWTDRQIDTTLHTQPSVFTDKCNCLTVIPISQQSIQQYWQVCFYSRDAYFSRYLPSVYNPESAITKFKILQMCHHLITM